jgi:hypothetical protein
MTQKNLKDIIRKTSFQKRKGGAEVISSILLVAITVVGAIILTTFLDESFVAGSLSSSGSDSTVKSIKLIGYDSRSGGNLMNFTNLNNTSSDDQWLCRSSCSNNPNTNPLIPFNGTEFIVIQIENRSVEPIFLESITLDNATHRWDSSTGDSQLQMDQFSVTNNGFPSDGKFSILSTDITDLTQRVDNQIQNGETVNLLIKLDATNPDIPLSKTIRAQFNIGANQPAEFLLESGGAQ